MPPGPRHLDGDGEVAAGVQAASSRERRRLQDAVADHRAVDERDRVSRAGDDPLDEHLIALGRSRLPADGPGAGRDAADGLPGGGAGWSVEGDDVTDPR